jgi:NDP-sugar pyrophosphorylase family protein
MIYYPISTLIDAGIDEFLIITSPGDLNAFQNLLGDGSRLGLSFRYEVQPSPDGLAQAFTIGREFLNGDSAALILGDNIFHGSNLGEQMRQSFIGNRGCQIFTYRVANPNDYGVITLDKKNKPIDIIEKPAHPDSNLAITGVYYFNNEVSDLANFGQLNVYKNNVDWSGLVVDFDVEFYFTIGESNGIYLSGEMTKIDENYLDMISKLQTFYEKFKSKWAKILASRKKTKQINK